MKPGADRHDSPGRRLGSEAMRRLRRRDVCATCEAATTAEHRTQTTTAVREAAAAILRIAGAIARAGHGTPAILDALTAVLARTQLSAMVDHLTDGSWHMPGHQPLPDARAHDLALRDRIARDRELLQ
ncbi:MAG: hypothetical protein J2P15_08740 [Micromonosporaceae bacterium]|nr:hypothetical protein [Micromonosporaceae bacterium]